VTLEKYSLTRAVCRLLIRLCSWIVPVPFRSDWRRHHEDEIEDWSILVDRGDILPQIRPILEYVVSVVSTTVEQRVRLECRQAGMRQFARTPRFAMGVLLSAGVVLAVLSGGFRGIRALLTPLPYPDPRRVVEFRAFVPFLGVHNEIPSETLELWRKGSRRIEAFAGYSIEGRTARVTPEFFRVLGVQPVSGRLFRDSDQPGCCAVVREGVPASNRIGTLPRGFWFRSRLVDTWVPLGRTGEQAVIARLKPGATAAEAQQELRELGRSGIVRPLIRQVQATRVELRPLGEAFRYPLHVAGGGLAVSLALLFVYIGAAAWMVKPRPHRRYWVFLFSKTAVVMVGFAAAWIEMAAAWPSPAARLDGPALHLMINWLFLLTYVGAVWQALRDQQRRCPVCLCRLTMPVVIGSWASSLIDPVSTELMCEEGHGTLHVPETQSSDREPEHWEPLDASWREAFQVPDHQG
jgi:hypothetical protein